MEAKLVVREAVRLAYSPPVVPKTGRLRTPYSIGWWFDATVVVLLVAFATLSIMT